MNRRIHDLDTLEKARFLAPGLIILDLTMPRMNGFQTTRELRAMKISAPVILFSVSAELIRPEQALAAAGTAMVAKEELCRLQLHLDTILYSVTTRSQPWGGPIYRVIVPPSESVSSALKRGSPRTAVIISS